MQLYRRLGERTKPPYGVNLDVEIELDQPNRFLDHQILSETSVVLAHRANRVYLSRDNGDSWVECYKANQSIVSGHIIDVDTITICFGDRLSGYVVQTVVLSTGFLGEEISVNAAWHGTQGIGSSEGTVIFAEYLSNNNRDELAHIYVSKDKGLSWVKSPFKNPKDFRHIHACFPDKFIKGKWIISTGGEPSDCKWYESFDDGVSWQDKLIFPEHPSFIESKHIGALMRATSICVEEEFYYWVTDDLLGNGKQYYNKLGGRFASGSKLVRLRKKDYTLSVFCDVGYHARSLIDCDNFFMVLTEAKVVGGSVNPQIHIIFKDDLYKSYHLGSCPNISSSSSVGSMSRASSHAFDNRFFSYMDPKSNQKKRGIAKYQYNLLGRDISFQSNSSMSELKEHFFASYKLPYRLTMDSDIRSPTLIILHGHGSNEKPTNFKKNGWNVLAPLDQYGKNGRGCWWLGEDNNFFIRDALQDLIKKLKNDRIINGDIYFYGSSMGGYGAILHGILCGAKGVYANVPQIKLIGSSYHQDVQRGNFDAISNSSDFIENDLSNLLNRNPSSIPLFFICENRFSYLNYLKEQSNSFVNECIERDINFHYEVLPKKGHDKNLGINQVVDLFEKYLHAGTSKEFV